MMTVLQLAVIGLAAMHEMLPLMAPLADMKFVHGLDALYNYKRNAMIHSGGISQGSLPDRITAIGYDAQISYSFNFSLLVFIFPPIGFFVLWFKRRLLVGPRFKFERKKFFN